MPETDTSNIYIPPGLVKDFAKELSIKTEESRERIAKRVIEICGIYDSGNSLIYWTRFDRAALNSIFMNHLVSREAKNTMLRSLASCDNVLLKLRDVCCFTMSCDSKATFIVKISSFVKKLDSPDSDLLLDCLETMQRWSREGKPANPKENDTFLIEIFDESSSNIPGEVDKELHQDYMEDRLGKLIRLVNTVCGKSDNSEESA